MATLSTRVLDQLLSKIGQHFFSFFDLTFVKTIFDSVEKTFDL